MKVRKGHLIPLAIILLLIITAWRFYPYMPERMATHWGFGIEPDGYSSRFVGTFMMPLIMIIAIVPITVIGIARDAFYENKNSGNLLSSIAILLSLFLFLTQILVLLWNAGVRVNVPIFMTIGVIILLCSVIWIVSSTLRALWNETPAKTTDRPDISSGGIYKDKLVEIDNETILFRLYYLSGGARRVELSQVEYIIEKEPTLANGRWRLHGTGDFRTWFPSDWGRPGRDKIFIMKLKDKWWRIGFTVENSQAVAEIFRNKGLLQPE